MLAQEPILVLITIYSSMVYAAFPVIFIDRHGLTISQNGLIFLGPYSNIWINGGRYKIIVREWRGFPPPERLLYPATIGGPLLVVGSFWLGWAGAYKAVPCTMIRSATAAAFPLFTTQMFNNVGCFKTILRKSLPFVLTRLLYRWAYNGPEPLLASLLPCLAPIPFIFLKYGARIRTRRSDLEIAKQLAAEKEAREKGGGV
ncbi:hypothetical protein F5148DRAFT_1278700 [Russula earlei]|uniref:Uncharacterized protein n=1 Tax=Russula earlei TaxID=71964 RepID=A0ACC0TRK8_9AGAM|nr:hypothetical protein F5148DRAFT_1278700 [Russula earlei]